MGCSATPASPLLPQRMEGRSLNASLVLLSCRLKALAATGRKTAEEASNWLRCHRDDPSLDDPIPQEYALFLCPTGSLLERLQEFWRESKRQCTRNRAHEVFPHITLCDFFTVSRHHVPQCSLTRHWGRSP
uniref:UBA domain-containing protein n=1 Tax=Ursus americanus TaxID=9643 RepID=A0A452QE25_URSAM